MKVCRVCALEKPVEEFPQGRRNRTKQCWPCMEVEAWHLNTWRATWINAEGVVVRRCSKCKIVKELATGFYRRARRKGERNPPTGPCKECWEVQVDGYRAKNPERKKAWQRAAKKRHLERVMADPVARAKLREDERIARRLKAEAEGRSIRMVAPRVSQRTAPKHLPSAPLVALIERLIDARKQITRDLNEPTQGIIRDICNELGVSERNFRHWRDGTQLTTRIGTAERVLMNANVEWHEVYSYDEFARHFLALDDEPVSR